MSVISVAVGHMLKAGMDSEAIVAAVADMEAATDNRTPRQKRNARYFANHSVLKRLNASDSDVSDAPSPIPPMVPLPPETPNPPLIPPTLSLPTAFVGEPTRNRYPDLFETFWQGYPTDANMSKKGAGKAWARLSAEDQRDAVASLPAFRKFCTDDPTYRPIHAERYLSQARFAGHLSAATEPIMVHDPDAPPLPGLRSIEEIRANLRNGGSH